MQVFSVELGWLPTVGADSWRHEDFAVVDPWRGGGGGHGALYPRVIRRCAA